MCVIGLLYNVNVVLAKMIWSTNLASNEIVKSQGLYFAGVCITKRIDDRLQDFYAHGDLTSLVMCMNIRVVDIEL